MDIWNNMRPDPAREPKLHRPSPANRLNSGFGRDIPRRANEKSANANSVAFAADRQERRRLHLAALAAVLFHVVIYFVLRALTLPNPIGMFDETALQVRLIDPSADAPVAVPPTRPMAVEPAVRAKVDGMSGHLRPALSNNAIADVANRAATVTSAPTPVGVPELFDDSGRVVLPEAGFVKDSDTFVTTGRVPEFAANPLDHLEALPFRPTRFNRRWVPERETLAGTFVRKGTFEKHWDTRGGNRIQCVLVVIFPACMWGWAPRVTIEELKAMRAELPPPRL